MFNKTENTSCENCKYYFKEQCRRNPPSANGKPWPVVMPKDWCGEFRMVWKSVSADDPDHNISKSDDTQNFLNGWYLE